MDNNKDYVVGYCKPPKNSQFKKGCSGNKKGRPARVTSITEAIAQELSSIVTITENGKPKKVTMAMVFAKKFINSSLTNNVARKQFINLPIDLPIDKMIAKFNESQIQPIPEEQSETVKEIQKMLLNEMDKRALNQNE